MHMSKTLIIGGTRGIGRAFAQMSIQDSETHIVSREPDPSPLGSAHYHICDVTKDDIPSIDGISKIVYCPGTINLKPIGSLKEEDFRADFETNVMGAVRVLKAYHRSLKKQEGAAVVLYSTVAVKQGMPFHASVAAAKAGVEGLARSLAAEMAPHVRVNCIAPSMTDTSLAAGILKNDKARENIASRHPLKRILDAEEIAAMTRFLLSDDARGITGQIIGVDAGMSALKL